MTVALLSGGNLSKERWAMFAVTKVFAVRTGWSIGYVLYRCPCWRLWVSLQRTNIPLYPLLLRLWIVSSTKGQDMITDTLCSASQGRALEKHHGFIVALVITLELIISLQTWGIQRVFELIGTRIRSWIPPPPFYSGSFVPETMNVRSEVFIPQHISQVQTTSVFEALD